MIPQLKLVGDEQQHGRTTHATGKPETGDFSGWQAPGFQNASADPVRRIFEHWVAMHGLLIRRCKLGPVRRTAIAAALAMGYEEPDLLLAIEGHAADPMEWARDEEMRRACRDLDWLMVREKRIEAAIERGENLRRLADEESKPRASSTPTDEAQPVDPAEAAAQREKLRALAARLRAGGAR